MRTDAANCFYPIFVKDDQIIGFGDVCPDEFHPESRNAVHPDGVIAVYPIDNNGIEKKWVFERGTVESIFDELWVKQTSDPMDGIDIMRTKNVSAIKLLGRIKSIPLIVMVPLCLPLWEYHFHIQSLSLMYKNALKQH